MPLTPLRLFISMSADRGNSIRPLYPLSHLGIGRAEHQPSCPGAGNYSQTGPEQVYRLWALAGLRTSGPNTLMLLGGC